MKYQKTPKTTLTVQIALVITAGLMSQQTHADAVTDWNLYTTLATKGAHSLTTGDKAIALNSNVSSRIDAISARAVFDAVNVIKRFSRSSYYYSAVPSATPTNNSASAAAAQAAHDVLLGILPNTASWAPTRAWLDNQLAKDLDSYGLNGVNDPGVIAGQNAAAAALAARQNDNSAIKTDYIPSNNLSPTGAINVTGNPGIGLWRPSNGGAGEVNINTGAPSGFDVNGNAVAKAAIDFNWKNVTPFALSTTEKQILVAKVPPALEVGSPEYSAELEFVKNHGQEFNHPGERTADQLLQALFYKADAELFTNEAARLGAQARGFSLTDNAKLFAALSSALADARIAAFQSKYDLDFWRPITALNTDANGAVSNFDAWKPLATTPSHPSNTGGHSSTVSAGTQVLRAFFKSDNIVPGNQPVTLHGLPWLVGTNNGTGQLLAPINGQDATTRNVTTLTQLQLENGRSRIYLGVHFANDDFQGQSLGLAVADKIIEDQRDPAVKGLKAYQGNNQVATADHLYSLLVENSAVSGFFGLDRQEEDHGFKH